MKTPKVTGERIKKYLAEGKRFDDRKAEEFRDIIIEDKVSKKAEGSVRVKIGKTEVIVGVKADVSEPYADSPDKGNLMTTCELLPLSSPRVELGKPAFPSIEIGRIIDRALRESGFIQFDKLCIKEGEKVWTIFVDIYSINDDGNLLDAAGIGAVAALRQAYLPTYDEKQERILYDQPSKNKVPTSDDNIPLSLTYYKVGDNFLVDPTKEEEDIAETKVTIGSYNGNISSMQKGDIESVEIEEFEKVLDMNDKVWGEVFKKLEKHIK